MGWWLWKSNLEGSLDLQRAENYYTDKKQTVMHAMSMQCAYIIIDLESTYLDLDLV